jgi:DNA-binding NtrC family response regulator
MSEVTHTAASADGVADDALVVVVIDTDPGVRWALEKGLARTGYEVVSAATVGEVLALSRQRSVSAIVMELLPEAGLTQDVLTTLVELPGTPRVVCVSVDAAPQLVIDCMRAGAADFVPKPFSLSEIRTSLARAMATDVERAVPKRVEAAATSKTDGSLLIGISHAMQELRAVIEEVSKTDLNCLLRGESGTGKDMVARELHHRSPRSDKPFIKVNCTALPEHLLESELFGYEKGAFTGAVSSKPGRFELAHKGVIFLDEIGDMHPNLQAKLLQVIEHKEFTKLGGTKQISVDVQIIAATNADLESKIKEGIFRDDLYFRLNEVCLWVPPLSARKEDVPLLIHHFIQKHGHFTDEQPELGGEELALLARHSWPGNVRELESSIKRWLALGPRALEGLSRKSVATNKQAAFSVPTPVNIQDGETSEIAAPNNGGDEDLPEEDAILEALESCQWNRRKAADQLGMSYQTLRRRIEKYGLNQGR